MTRFRSFVLSLLLVLFSASGAFAQNGVFLQGVQHQCFDPFLFAYLVPTWPAGCVPPAPFDMVGRPNLGWAGAPACTTGGALSCNPGDTYDTSSAHGGPYPIYSGVGEGHTGNSGTFWVNHATVTAIPGAQVSGLFVPASGTVEIQVDGSTLLNTLLNAQTSIVAVTLQREGPTGTFTNLFTKNVHTITGSASPTINGVTPFAFNYLDRPAAVGVYSYRVVAQLTQATGPQTFIGANNNATRARIIVKLVS